VTESLGPVEYFEVTIEDRQIILTPVKIQRSDAVRDKLAALNYDRARWGECYYLGSWGFYP